MDPMQRYGAGRGIVFFLRALLCSLWEEFEGLMYRKVIFGFILLILSSGLVPAQQRWWYTLEQGKRLFASGAYGDALMAFEDARRERLDQFTRMESDMILLLSNPNVRRFGDSLEYVESYIADNRETAAAEALSELYHRFPRDSLRGSVQRVLQELDRQKGYPEAEYWLGEVYRAESEISLAFRQYARAWENRSLLENPEFDVEILYKMMEIHRLRREYQEMERKANEIIEEPGPLGLPRDALWENNASNTRAAMARVLENEGVDRFLTLYRYNNAVTERAHRLLGFFCYSSNRYSLAAEHLMFAFLIQNTVLIEEAIRSNYDFTYSSLDELVDFARSKPALASYLEETDYYRTIYCLASALYAARKNRPAAQLWAFLAGRDDAGEWGARARRNPSPFIDRAVEMP